MWRKSGTWVAGERFQYGYGSVPIGDCLGDRVLCCPSTHDCAARTGPMALSDAAERRELVRVLRDQDVANPQVAAELRARFGVGPMLAWRWVTDLSLAEAAERY